VRVPIVTYHRVHEFATEYTKSIPDETVEPAVFAAEMRALRRSGFHAVSQRRLFRALFDGARLPGRPVLITVDDGYVDAVTQILPVLRANHMVATFYVITGRTREQGFLNARQIRRLDRAGMDVGAHTRTHVPLATLPTAAAQREVAGSRRDLQRILGHPVYWFAYPYGSTDAAVAEQVRRAGFLLAVTTNGGTSESSLAPFALPRLHVGRAATPATVVALARGAGGAAAHGGD
jgi:peptidoglycan/xylan/chitin deacetylase (PgdA/CDA1 family)